METELSIMVGGSLILCSRDSGLFCIYVNTFLSSCKMWIYKIRSLFIFIGGGVLILSSLTRSPNLYFYGNNKLDRRVAVSIEMTCMLLFISSNYYSF